MCCKMTDSGPWDVLFLSYTELNSAKLYDMVTSSWMNNDDVLAFLSDDTVSNIGLSNELAQLDDAEMDNEANSTDKSEQ